MSLDSFLGLSLSERNSLAAPAVTKRESAIKLATEKRRKLDIQEERLRKLQRSNGLVFNKDGTFGVVQQNYSQAKKREIPVALAASAEKKLLAAPNYVPLKFNCLNPPHCDKVSHNHRRDFTRQKQYRARDYYYDKYAKLLMGDDAYMEARSIPDLSISADLYTSQPVYVKDLFNLVLAFAREHDRIFPESCEQMYAVEMTEMCIRQSPAHHPEALEQRLGVLETSRESVRSMYTDAKDIVHRKFSSAAEYTIERLIQAKALTPAAKATFSMYMQKLFRDYLASHDQTKLMQSLVDKCREEQASLRAVKQ